MAIEELLPERLLALCSASASHAVLFLIALVTIPL